MTIIHGIKKPLFISTLYILNIINPQFKFLIVGYERCFQTDMAGASKGNLAKCFLLHMKNKITFLSFKVFKNINKNFF